MAVFYKDPDAVLDYQFIWTDWLAGGETISSQVVSVDDTDLVIDSDAEAGGVVTVWLSGGIAGTTYALSCRITTSASRVDERTMKIRVKER